MAQDFRVFSDPAIAHREICMLHDNERLGLCCGTLKRGGDCVNRAIGAPVPLTTMPTCKIHQNQLKVAGYCRAVLDCNFECGRLFERKPHGFPRCSSHVRDFEICYFLQILPIELRLRVYGFLLPDLRIPAQYESHRLPMQDERGVYAAILRVNRQVHDESAGLLYGCGDFTLNLFGERWTMCSSPRRSFTQDGAPRLHDYQMQLMLLEHQNKRRLMNARQAQSNMIAGSSVIQARAAPDNQLSSVPPVTSPHRPPEPVWCPPLGARYFDMIRFFHIEIVFGGLTFFGNAPNSLRIGVQDDKALELQLFNYCDNIHRLIGRLQSPIAHIEITIKFANLFSADGAFSAAKMLLKPFFRLSNVTEIRIHSITMRDMDTFDEELLPVDSIPTNAIGMPYLEFMKRLPGDPSEPEPSFEYRQVFESYWKLEKLLYDIKKNFFYADSPFHSFTELLHTARIAREEDNLASFREVWEQVINVWFDYLNSSKEFRFNIAQSIDAINGAVGSGSETRDFEGGSII